MDELISDFCEEARDILTEIGSKILELEENPGNKELLQELFRSAHTLKGSSGIVGATAVSEVSHILEELLEALLDGRMNFTSEIADVFLRAFDYIGELVSLFVSGRGVVKEKHLSIINELNCLRDEKKIKQEEMPAGSSNAESRDFLKNLSRNTLQKVFDEVRAVRGTNHSVYQIVMKFDQEIFLTGQDPLLLLQDVMSAGEILEIVVHAEDLPDLDDLDPEHVYLWFEVFIKAPARMFDEFENIFEFLDREKNYVLVAELKEEELRNLLNMLPAGLFPGADLSEEAVIVLKELIRQQKLYIEQNRDRDDSFRRSFYRVVKAVARALNCESSLAGFLSQKDACWDACLEAVEYLEALLKGAGNTRNEHQVELREPDAQKTGLSDHSCPKSGSNVEDADTQVLKENLKEKKYLRVEESYAEKLFELAGELSVAKNSIPYLIRKLETKWGIPEAARELKSKYQALEQISREFQDIVMSLRVLPASHIFQRFPRFVRDASKKLGKNVKLVIEGEDTKIDKAVLEKVYEPLLHLIRNSLDHGIEPPDERKMRGKSPVGSLILRAGHKGHSIYIEVEDDGKGIDVSNLLRTALNRRVISEEEAGKMSFDDALNLIFLPGFSTKQAAGELSGRGVGMDVVKNVVEELGGRVSINNKPGEGVLFHLELPLTLATTRVLVIRLGENYFGLPLEDVQEVVRVARTELHNIGKTDGVCLRGKVVPVVYLGEILGMRDYRLEETLSIVIISSGFGLVVSGFEGEADIMLKPLPGELNSIDIYSGASFLSDGSILLVFNPKNLWREKGMEEDVIQKEW